LQETTVAQIVEIFKATPVNTNFTKKNKKTAHQQAANLTAFAVSKYNDFENESLLEM
jgi:hypothetical protein